MKSSCSFTMNAVFSVTSAMAKQAIAVVLIFCLLFNCVIPRFIIGHENAFTMLAMVMEKQSEIVHFSMIYGLSIKLMSALVEWSTNKAYPTSSSRSKGKSSKSENTSSEYSLVRSEQRSNEYRWARMDAATGISGIVAEDLCRYGVIYRIGRQSTGVRTLLLLLLLFMVFGRRGISGEADSIAGNYIAEASTGFGLSIDRSSPVFIYSDSDPEQKRIQTRRPL